MVLKKMLTVKKPALGRYDEEICENFMAKVWIKKY